MKSEVWRQLDDMKPRMIEIALSIGNNPELGTEEYYAADLLTNELEARGFIVTCGILGMKTAFVGEYRSGKPGPILAYLCEYDALPELGHACGHHLICTMSLAAAAALKPAIERFGGTLRVYGTPAEETNGAKVPMAEAGLFDDVDAAMMAHPYSSYEASGTSLAMDAVQYEFHGKAAHAAASPHVGINALDAVIQLFNAVSALRQQMRSDARVHGIIADGGKAPNIIPDYSCARFYIRSADRPYTNELTKRIRSCAEGAAAQTGCALTVTNYEYSYDELRTNKPLSETFNRNLHQLGVDRHEITSGKDNGSLDLGNVSLHCPAIHPYVKVCDEPFRLHTPEFRDGTMTEKAMDYMMIGAKALAGTGFDILTEAGLLDTMKNRQVAGQL